MNPFNSELVSHGYLLIELRTLRTWNKAGSSTLSGTAINKESNASTCSKSFKSYWCREWESCKKVELFLRMQIYTNVIHEEFFFSVSSSSSYLQLVSICLETVRRQSAKNNTCIIDLLVSSRADNESWCHPNEIIKPCATCARSRAAAAVSTTLRGSRSWALSSSC